MSELDDHILFKTRPKPTKFMTVGVFTGGGLHIPSPLEVKKVTNI